jgi:hypothetical protein
MARLGVCGPSRPTPDDLSSRGVVIVLCLRRALIGRSDGSIEEVVMWQQGQVFKLKVKGRDGRPLWALRYRLDGRDSMRPQGWWVRESC